MFVRQKHSLRPWFYALIVAVIGLSMTVVAPANQPAAINTINIEVFVRNDSERCDNALKYLRDLTSRRSGLELVVHDVLQDQAQLKRLWDLAKRGGYDKPAVPMVYCCRKIHIGFDSAAITGPKIENLFTMHVYTRSTCPRCQKAKVFLRGMQQRWPGLKIAIYEITYDIHAREQWNSLSRQYHVPPSLPTVHFSGRLIVGYQGDSITGFQIESLVREATGNTAARAPPRIGLISPIVTGMSLFVFQLPVGADDNGDSADSIDDLLLPEEADDVPGPDDAVVLDIPDSATANDDQAQSDVIYVPILGELRVSSLGLPAFTFLVGLVDGFNPCAMWVLVFLLSVLVNINDRRKMIAIAGTFVVISGVAYFAFMAAWLNVFKLIGLARPVQITLGCMAAFIGIVNIKDFLAFKKGLSFSIPESQKPGIYARVRDIVNAKYLTAAVAAAIGLAIVVNIVELLCTAGLPALYTQILMMQELPMWANYCYLGLYNIAYMLDDSILLAIVVVTLSRHRLQEREGRYLKLLSGVVILVLGLMMIFRPEWLQLTA